MTAVSDYLAKVGGALKAGNATEHTHRPALKSFIEALREGLTATNEPKRIECGAPDFIITTGSTPVGYIEAKDVGTRLSESEKTPQIKRYLLSLRNLILTDYLDFKLYRNGELIRSLRLANRQTDGGIKAVLGATSEVGPFFDTFFDAQVPAIANPRDLAERMARITRLLHDLIRQAFALETETGEFHSQHSGFRKILMSELTVDQFSDMYAQTITYGLFAARCNHQGEGFNRAQAGQDLPKTNPFLRRLFNTIAGVELDDRIAWAVDDLASLLAKADMVAILADFGRRTRQYDPVVHFYETFLTAYDPRLRELRGVYYTPEPVVGYIVRSVDAVLKQSFGLDRGLADHTKVKLKKPKQKGKKQEFYETHRVQILDPACGTGTFLHEVISTIRQTFAGNAGLWPAYVRDHLLPRTYGFEILMASYAVAHMKLGIQLKDSKYDFGTDERLRVFLTNTLEEAHEATDMPLFTQWLAEEAAAASEIKKDVPIMVVLGNPPYSRHSINKGSWIAGLLNEYKRDPSLRRPGQAKPLTNDYVKFFRFSQWRIENTGYGVMAFITARGYLDDSTLFDMRESLMRTFDDIFILDLHGSSNYREQPTADGVDENVFDIQQGVAIAILVRRTTRADKCSVYRADLRGTRQSKYDWLDTNTLATTTWANITPTRAPWFFVSQDVDISAEYEQGWSVADIFNPNGRPGAGVVTTHDGFAISLTKAAQIKKVEAFLATQNEEQARNIFRLCTTTQWNYLTAKSALQNEAWRQQLVPILYRPFDIRWTVWNSHVAVHRRERVFSHLMAGDNIALITARSNKTGGGDHFFVTTIASETKCGESSTQSVALPLWLYEEVEDGLLGEKHVLKESNLNAAFVQALTASIGEPSPQPEQIFSYIYAVLYSPTYRQRYSEFINRGYPRVPLPGIRKIFERLSDLGRSLINLHLLADVPTGLGTFPVAGNNTIAGVIYKVPTGDSNEGNVYINEEQHFTGVSEEVWEYTIGGYQIADKWLKDRRGQTLTFDDLTLYQRILKALARTIEVQDEIASIVPSWSAV